MTPEFAVVISTFAAITSTMTMPDVPVPPTDVPAVVATTMAPVVDTPPIVAVATAAVAPSSVTAEGTPVAPPIPDPGPVQAPVAPPTPTPAIAPAPVSKKLTLDLREMDITDVLKMLARQNNLNLVIGKNVSGRVTVTLNQVEFWQAFRMILGTRDLAYSQEGDLIYVMTSSDYERMYGVPFLKKTQLKSYPLKSIRASTAKGILETLKSKVGTITVEETSNTVLVEDTPESLALIEQKLAGIDVPLEMRVIRVNYASVEEIQPKIASLVSKDIGNLQVDKRSNTIVVQDNPMRVKEIADVVQAMDARDKTVLIEAKIMQITLNKQFQMGINWQGVNWTQLFEKLNGYHITGNLVQNLQLVDPQTVRGNNVTATGITAQIGILEKPNFQTVINALETVGTANLLSSPRITAMNRQEAKIHVGSKVAKITRTLINAGSTTTSPITTENVEFLDVGVKLAVTPVITDENTVLLKVRPEVSSVENTITTNDGSSIPVIRVSEAEASLVVKDGITVVLGGLMEDSKSRTQNQVPFIGRIPLIGMLFRNKQKSSLKTELVIFLTPRIVNGDLVSPEAQTKFDLQPDGQPKKRGFWKRLFRRK